MAKKKAAVTPTDGNIQQVLKESIQRRMEERPLSESFVTSFWFGRRSVVEDEIAEWWSEWRDRDLRDFWMRPGNDILAGAVSSMVKKFKSMNWVLEGPERVVNRYQPVLAEAEIGQGWGVLLAKTLTDYLTQDKGAFWELIGPGKADGPLETVRGVAHLDAGRCQLTGDPVYPVLFGNPKDDKPHKLHATRVVHMVDMPSPNEQFLGVGFCAVSRVIASSQVLLKLAKYKNEKLSDLPEAGLLLFNNLLPQRWEDAKAEHARERRRLNQELWSNILVMFGLDPAQPVTAELLSFANLPDSFNEREATDIYVNIVALAFGVDVREFWPLSAGPLGTAAETLIQHQKARGKGVGDIVSTLERAINWKVLPPPVNFHFDFENDEEDMQRAEIAEVKVKTIMSMWEPAKYAAVADPGIPPPVSREEIRQMLADNVPGYFKEDFLETDVTEEVEATDVEREKMWGPRVAVDWKGDVRRLGRRRVSRVEAAQSALIGKALAMAEEKYKAGKLSLDDLVEFRLGAIMDERSVEEP